MRSFTIISILNSSSKLRISEGRYESETPSGAAKKMFSQAIRNKKTKPVSLLVTLRETTQGSKKKEYTYRVKKVNDPKDVERNGELVHYRFSTKTVSKN